VSAGDARVVAMTAAHLKAVAGLAADLGYADEAAGVAERFPALARDPDHGLFVAVAVDGDVVGFIHVHARHMLHDADAAQVQAMAVVTSHRRRGIGSLLLAEAEAWAARRGFAAMTLYSAGGRDDAHGFYAALGYAPKTGLSRYDKALASTTAKRRKA
jgi:GNAT superfamily N-acetyltransferase